MDRHNAQRELTSQLISDLYRTVFNSDDIALGFSQLLAGIDDLLLDTPDAHNVSTDSLPLEALPTIRQSTNLVIPPPTVVAGGIIFYC